MFIHDAGVRQEFDYEIVDTWRILMEFGPAMNMPNELSFLYKENSFNHFETILSHQ